MRLAFWRRKTIAEHMAPITAIVEGLQAHAEHHDAQAAEHERAADELLARSRHAQAEREQALAQVTLISGVFR